MKCPQEKKNTLRKIHHFIEAKIPQIQQLIYVLFRTLFFCDFFLEKVKKIEK